MPFEFLPLDGHGAQSRLLKQTPHKMEGFFKEPLPHLPSCSHFLAGALSLEDVLLQTPVTPCTGPLSHTHLLIKLLPSSVLLLSHFFNPPLALALLQAGYTPPRPNFQRQWR